MTFSMSQARRCLPSLQVVGKRLRNLWSFIASFLNEAYRWCIQPFWRIRAGWIALKRRVCAWLGWGRWKTQDSFSQYHELPHMEQMGCWGLAGLWVRRYHRPPFTLALCRTTKNFAFMFSRGPVATHPRGVSFYLLPAGLTGWMWRFLMPLAVMAFFSFLPVLSVMGAMCISVGMLMAILFVVYVIFYAFSFPVLSSIWQRANWTNRYDYFLYSLFPPENKNHDSYKRKSLGRQLLHAMWMFPNNNAPHSFLGDLSPQTAILRTGIMDMLSTDSEGPAPLWCGHPVIRWMVFWLYPAWSSFLFMLVWLISLVYIKHYACEIKYIWPLDLFIKQAFCLFNISLLNLGFNIKFSDGLMLLINVIYVVGLTLWFVLTIVFLMRIGRYLKKWLVMPVYDMNLLLPLIAAQTPQLRNNAIFLEDKATTKAFVIASSLCALVLTILQKVFLNGV